MLMMMRRMIFLFAYIRVLGPKTFGQADEFCFMETFNATCPTESEVVVMDAASYGRMRVGRCVSGTYGFLGCSVDVLPVLDRKCSGRRSCQFTLPDADLFKTRPCPGDFTSYLEASFHCQPVETSNGDRCKDDKASVLTGVCGYLASIIAEDGGFGSRACPWIIRTHPGQRINITLHNFIGAMTQDVRAPPLLSQPNKAAGGGGGDNGGDLQRVGVCFEVAALFDSMDRKLVTICSGDSRQSVVLLSKTNTVRVEFLRTHLLKTLGAFLLEYRVFGCGNTHLPPSSSPSSSSSSTYSPPSPLSSSSSPSPSSASPAPAAAAPSSGVRGDGLQAAMWFRRNGETMMVGCNSSSSVVWYLVCKDRMWHGEVGNCSSSHVTDSGWRLEHIFIADDAFPIGILIIVMIGVATGIVVGGFILCLINFVTKRGFRQRELTPTAKNAKLSQLLSERSPFLVDQQRPPALDGAFAGWPYIPPPQPIISADDSQSTTIYYDSRRSIPGSNFLCDPCHRGHDLVSGDHDLGLSSSYIMEKADDVDERVMAGNGRLLCRASFSKSLRSECSLQPTAAVRTHIYDYPQFETRLI